MKSLQRSTVLMRVHISDRNVAKAALEEFDRDRHLSVNVLRGRISQEDASFELAVTGPAGRIKEFIRRSDAWGASVGPSPLNVA